MRDRLPADDQSLAILYALGGLDLPERLGAQRRRQTDPTFDRLVDMWELRLAEGLLDVIPEMPPAGLWHKINDELFGAEAKSLADLSVARVDTLAWEPFDKGLAIKVLTRSENGNPAAFLMRLAPGAIVPEHDHDQDEECLILEGDLIHEGRVLGPGDFILARSGGHHSSMTSHTGALLFVRYASK